MDLSISRLFKKNTDDADSDVLETGVSEVIQEGHVEEEIPLSKRVGKLPVNMVRKTHEQLSHVATLRFVIAVLVGLLIVSLYTTSQIPGQIVVKVAPQMQSGISMKIGEYPKASILSDIQYLWLDLNTWDESGDEQAKPLVDRYQHFLSPEFQTELKEKYDALSKRGALKRKRFPSAVPGQLFQFDERVIEVNKNAWKVYLDIKIEEKMGTEVVRAPTYRFFFLVERYEQNLEYNPLGLRIVGFSDEPKRIKD